MTGAGKTHTMFGSEANPGIILQSVRTIFEKLEKETQSILTFSFLEIYNENVRDLLTEN